MFYTRVPLELSQLVVTLDCISTKKLSLFCLSNIVFYGCKSQKWGFPGPDLSQNITVRFSVCRIVSIIIGPDRRSESK